jgi:hypothetical protein
MLTRRRDEVLMRHLWPNESLQLTKRPKVNRARTTP